MWRVQTGELSYVFGNHMILAGMTLKSHCIAHVGAGSEPV
jgi:hypothetical protein